MNTLRRIKYFSTLQLKRKKDQSYKRAIYQLFLAARSLNEKNDLKFSREMTLLESFIQSYNFDNRAYIKKKIYNKRFTNKKRYLN